MANDAPFGLGSTFRASGSQRGDFVNKDDAGRVLLGFLEDASQAGFAFAVEFVHNLRTVDDEESSVGFGGNGACDQRFAGAWRAVEQNTLGWFNAQAIENGRI